MTAAVRDPATATQRPGASSALLGAADKARQPEPVRPAVGMLYRGRLAYQSEPRMWAVTATREDFAYIREDGVACTSGIPLTLLATWPCIGIETPAGRVMVGEVRESPGGAPARLARVAVGAFGDVGFVIADPRTGKDEPGVWVAEAVASWPLISDGETLLRALGQTAREAAPAVECLWGAHPASADPPCCEEQATHGPEQGRYDGETDETLRRRIAKANDPRRPHEPRCVASVRCVLCDPYVAGRDREETWLLSLALADAYMAEQAERRRREEARPSARTLALRALTGEQTVAEAYRVDPGAMFDALMLETNREVAMLLCGAKAAEQMYPRPVPTDPSPTAAAMLDAQRRAERRR